MKDGFELFLSIATSPPSSKKIIYFKPELSNPYVRLGELGQLGKRFKGRVAHYINFFRSDAEYLFLLCLFEHLITSAS